jgi:hypothetical protein
MERYEVQVIHSQRDGVNYRITDKNGDNRIGTSYDPDNAKQIVDALNFYDKYYKHVTSGIIVDGVIVEK